MNKIKNRLSSKAGESISETLVALLISALALVMLAGVVSTSSRIVTRSRERLNRYYDVNDQMVLSGGTTGGTITIKDSSGKTIAQENIYYSINDVFENKKVVSYELR